MFNLTAEDMPGATLDQILDSYGTGDSSTLATAPSFSTFLYQNTKGAFEDYTTVGRGLEEKEIIKKEKEAGHFDQSYYDAQALAGVPGASLVERNRFAMDEKAWKASTWYREGIEYSGAMTPERAEVLAQAYDERRFRETLIAAGDEAYGLGGTILGFGAMMLGGLPDPINLIPFSGGARSAKTAVTAAIRVGANPFKAGVAAGMKAGAIEGAMGGAVSSMLTMPDLARKGEDIGYADFLSTIGVSAGLGSLFGGAGGGLSAFRGIKADKAMRTEINAWLDSEEAKSTESLRLAHQQAIYQAYLNGIPGVDAKQAEQWAIADAALFDKRAHTWATRDKQGKRQAIEYYADPRNYPEWVGVFSREEAIRQEFGTVDNNFLDSFGAASEIHDTGNARSGSEVSGAPQTPQETIAATEVAPLNLEERGPIFQETERPGVRGRDEKLATSQGDEDIHFEVRELDELVPSHNPSMQFQKRQDYPADIQERPYHSDTGEQDKVRRNAANLDPRYLINDNPDASTGAPIVTKGGIVLGGNSRTMSMQLASQAFPEKSQAYREALIQNAERFGIDPEQIQGMKNPVLVRVNSKDMSLREMAQASRRYNEVTTQALQVEAEGVSKAKLISTETISHLNEQLSAGQFNTLRDFLNDPSSKDFVQLLIRDGVIEQTQVSRLVDDDGFLKPGGKEVIENALRGIIVPSYDLIRATPTAVMNKVDRAIPYLAQLKAATGKWDVSKAIIEALQIISAARSQRKDVSLKEAVWAYLNQGSLLEGGPKHKQAAQILALTLTNASPKEVAVRFAQMAQDASVFSRSGGETSSLLGGNVQVAMGPADSFIRSFLRPVASSDGVLVHAFDPGKKIEHEALQFLIREGGAQKALAKLQEMKADSNLSPEEIAKASDLMGAVGRISGGKHQIYDVNLDGFTHNPQDTLFSSYRARETSISEFVQRVKSEPKEAKQSYFAIPLAEENKDVEFYVSSDMARHQKKRHPTMTLADYENIEFVAKNINSENTIFNGMNGTYGARFIGHQKIGDKHYGYVFDVNKHGKATLITFFVDNEKNIESWLNSSKKKASKVSVDDNSNIVNTQTRTFPLGKPTFENLHDAIESVKQIDASHFNQESFGAGARGAVNFSSDGRPTIEFFQAADFSTAPHEMYHVFRREIERTAFEADSSAEAKQRWKDVCDFVGAKEGEKWTREQEEKFALAAERYLAEGIAPTPTLKTVFDKMKEWFLSLYKKLDAVGVDISPKMREVFDGMLNGELPRNELGDVVRSGISPMPKRDLFRAMEKALQDLNNGDPVDVGPVLHDSQALNSVQSVAERYGTTEELEGGMSAERDFSTERVDEHPEAPPLISTEQQTARDLEAETAFHEEIAEGIERARQEGVLTEDDIRELLQNREHTERVQQFDEIGQGALECVWNAAV